MFSSFTTGHEPYCCKKEVERDAAKERPELKGSDWIEGACIKTVRIQFKFLDDLPKL